MPVRLPLTVRVPAVRGPAEIASVTSGVDRALADACTLLRDRHGVGGPLVWRPTVIGADAPDVVGAVRAALARRGAVVDGVELPMAGRAAPDTAVRERRRPERQDRDHSTYRVQFYDDGDEGEVPATPPGESGIPTMAEVRAGLRARLAAGTPTPGRYGGVDLGGGFDTILVWLDASSGVEVFWTGRFSSLRPPAEGSDRAVTVHQRASWSASGVTIESRGPATDEWVLERVDAFINAHLPDLAGDERAALRERYRVALAREMEGRVLVAITGEDELVAATGEYADKRIEVEVDPTPIPEAEGGGSRGGGAGGEGGGGEDGVQQGGGGRGGPLGGEGGGEGESALWPRRASRGDAWTCESFEGERALPAVAEINQSVAERLTRGMEHLAQELEIPTCEFAGHFALNAARSIGGIAHAIGLAARSNPGRTDVVVKPNGGGNNGVVDITPQETPGLLYLRHLAALVGPVLAYGQSVQSSYDALGDGKAVDYTTQWSISFLNELGDAIEASCAVMFAETCRVILLQQLESTRETLQHRSTEGFDDTVRHFESALGILGERIVAADLLQRAMRRADQLYRNGSAREILSAPDPHRRGPGQHMYGVGGGYVPYVAPAITAEARLALVENAEVVGGQGNRRISWRGREWTTQDFDDHKQMRRAFLNRIDPLFLQVENLTAVHARVARDESAEPYLRELLTTLRSANTSITTKVKDADDGLWFAVETSQYIEAEGGYTELGTRYVMHGIHGLADAELRPNIFRATFQYNNGFDLAIGRKARQDFAESLLELGAMAIVAIVCAPLGAVVAAAAGGVVGIGFAIDDVLDAAEKEEIYRSLENPETVLSWQEVQLEWLMAGLSIAFSVFDVIAVGKALRAGMVPLKQALREGAQEAIRRQSRQILRNLGEGAIEHGIRQAAQEVVAQELLSRLMLYVIAPVMADVARSVAIEHGLGVDVDALIAGGQEDAPQTTTLVRSGQGGEQ